MSKIIRLSCDNCINEAANRELPDTKNAIEKYGTDVDNTTQSINELLKLEQEIDKLYDHIKLKGNPHNSSLCDIPDTSIQNPLDGQYLRYNSKEMKWVNSFMDIDPSLFIKISGANDLERDIDMGANSIFNIKQLMIGGELLAASSKNRDITCGDSSITCGDSRITCGDSRITFDAPMCVVSETTNPTVNIQANLTDAVPSKLTLTSNSILASSLSIPTDCEINNNVVCDKILVSKSAKTDHITISSAYHAKTITSKGCFNIGVDGLCVIESMSQTGELELNAPTVIFADGSNHRLEITEQHIDMNGATLALDEDFRCAEQIATLGYLKEKELEAQEKIKKHIDDYSKLITNNVLNISKNCKVYGMTVSNNKITPINMKNRNHIDLGGNDIINCAKISSSIFIVKVQNQTKENVGIDLNNTRIANVGFAQRDADCVSKKYVDHIVNKLKNRIERLENCN